MYAQLNESASSEVLAQLVYELLDAHFDTARLARDLTADPGWQGHLGYLRDLQRVAREVLACTSDGGQEVLVAAPAQREAG